MPSIRVTAFVGELGVCTPLQGGRIIFIGPAAETMGGDGRQDSCPQANDCGRRSVVPGTEQPLQSAEEAVRICNEIGYPVMLKASMGGGGKGMRLIHNESEVVEAYNTARSESMSSFGDDTVYLEKFVEEPHHIEFQILGDNHGNVIHLFDRECSVQRRNQKVVESPSPFLTPELRREMGEGGCRSQGSELLRCRYHRVSGETRTVGSTSSK